MNGDNVAGITDAMGWPLHGAAITPMDATECKAWLGWLGGGSAPLNTHGVQWAIVQWDRAFAWGCVGESGWVWGETYPSASGRLLEARIFGPEAEALLWNSRDGHRGRILKDAPCEAGLAPLKLKNYTIELDNRMASPPATIQATEGFIVRSSEGGNMTVTPRGRGISACHYLSQCPVTGVLRIAATRFMEVK